MKKLLLSALAVCAFTFSNAQEEKTEGTSGFAQGDMMISGSFGIASQSEGDAKASGFNISPRAAYFLTDNIAVGVKLGYKSNKAENAAGVDTVDESRLTAGAMARYYMSPASKFSLFAELGVDYSNVDYKLADAKGSEIGVGVSPGVSYFLSDSFALEASWGLLGYTTNDNGGDGADKTNTFGLGLDMDDLSLGLVYKF